MIRWIHLRLLIQCWAGSYVQLLKPLKGAKDIDDIKFNYMLMPKPDTPEHVAEWKRVLAEYENK